MAEMVSRIVDLNKLGKTLLSGPTSGKDVAVQSDLTKVVKLEIIANEKMLITSSFFVGLLSKVDVKESQISHKGFSNQTQCEFKRALKRL